MTSIPSHRSEQTGSALLDRLQRRVGEVIEYLRSLAWVPNRAYTALAKDVTAPLFTYADLISARLATTADKSFLLITFTASGVQQTTVSGTFFQVLVDGVVVKGAGTTPPLTWPYSVSIVVRVPVKKSAHSVAVQWNTQANTSSIRALTHVEEHAHLYVEEVPA